MARCSLGRLLSRTHVASFIPARGCSQNRAAPDKTDIPPPPISLNFFLTTLSISLQNHKDQTKTCRCTPSRLKRASRLYLISRESEALLVDSPTSVGIVWEAAAANILQVHFNWLRGGRELWNSTIRKVDEDRKLDCSHLTQKTAHYTARDGPE